MNPDDCDARLNALAALIEAQRQMLDGMTAMHERQTQIGDELIDLIGVLIIAAGQSDPAAFATALRTLPPGHRALSRLSPAVRRLLDWQLPDGSTPPPGAP